ncbi:MAG: LysR substrate-binding domain-containing protein [Pseudomonadota bacterium]
MDIEGLRLFVLCAERLNISAAGRALGLAPAVATARLAKLERALGADLLHRTTRKVSLSLEGSEFLPYARDIIAQADAGKAALGIGRLQAAGTVRFAAPSTFAQLYLAPLIPEFLAAHPGVSLDLRLSDSQFDLIEGSFDLALRNIALTDTSLKGRKLADDMRILCAAPAYLRERGAPVTPAELGAHRLIGFKNAGPRRLSAACGASGVFDPSLGDGRLTVDDGLTLKLVTVAGAGISANSRWSVHRELAEGALVRVLPDYLVEEDTALWLIYPKSNVLSAKVRVLIDFLTENLGGAKLGGGRG